MKAWEIFLPMYESFSGSREIFKEGGNTGKAL